MACQSESSATANVARAEAELQRFGLTGFRGGQRRVIDALLDGRSAAAVFPTGGGKSLCYQLTSQLLPGVTIVVSPLIALMKDQCDAMRRQGIEAVRLDSSLSPEEFRKAMDGVRSGTTKLLYVAPERFFNERFRASVGSLRVSLFAVDEAHCISQWGHNFRPDYLKLAQLAGELSAERVLALTATATPRVLQDICDAFQIAPDDAVCTPFYRPNLQIRSCVLSADAQLATLIDRLAARPRGPTLVYVSQQKTTEQVAEQLVDRGLPARAYHAGMETNQRTEVQQWFLQSRDGIVAATIAFGMGIDKADIRYVYHYNPPKSLESYAQEIGRAGRDGADAVCEMLLVPEDRIVLENFTYGDTPSPAAVVRLVQCIAGQGENFFISQYRLSTETDVRLSVVRTLLTYLELDGYLQATAPRYDSYQFRPRVTSKVILSRFQGERRQFIAGLLASAVKSRTWFTIPLAVAARRLNEPRERLVQALDYLAQQDWIELKVADLVHGYRRKAKITSPGQLGDQLYQRLLQREEAEVGRLDEVFELVRAPRCQAVMLSEHFGQALPEPCGRCSHCMGEAAGEIPPIGGRRIGRSAAQAVQQLAKEHPEILTDDRQQARFLCGLSSPAMTRARLSRHPSFGVCGTVPFATVLQELKVPA